MQRDGVTCLKAAWGVGLGQERSRRSVSQCSGCALRVSALCPSSPSQKRTAQPGDDKAPLGKPTVPRNADLPWENTKEMVPPEQ